MDKSQGERRPSQQDSHFEERGILTEVVLPIAQTAVEAGVSAGVGAYVGAKVAQSKGDQPKKS
jgi:hypothetical protein